MQAEKNYKASKRLSQTRLRERLLKGIGAQGFSQAVQIFIRLAEVPLLLSFWGPQLYGEWLMLAAIPVYFSMVDGGFIGVTCREMTMQSAAGNHNNSLVLYQSTWTILVAISIFTTVLAFCLVQYVPLHRWLNFSAMSIEEVTQTFIVLVLCVLLRLQNGLMNGAYWVVGRYANSMYFNASALALEFIGLALSVIGGGGPVHASYGLLCGRLIGTIIMYIGKQRICPWMHYGISNVSLVELKRLFAPAFASLSFPFGNALNIQGVRVAVGLVMGPSALALFVPLRTLSRFVMQPSNIIDRIVGPELALAFGRGDSPLFQHLFRKSCQFSLWGSLLICILIGPGANWIFPIWTGGEIDLQWPTYLALLSVVMVNSVWTIGLTLPYSINKHGHIAFSYTLIYGISAILLSFAGAYIWGLIGTAFSLLIIECWMTVAIISYSLKLSNLKATQFVSTLLQPPIDLFDRFYPTKFLKKRLHHNGLQ